MFVILLHYLKPIEDVERVVVPHRAYLDELYAKGVLLASGPQVPRTGGVLLAKGMDKDALWDILKKDPFHTEGIAEYKLIEFDPIKHHVALKELI
ncbi:MAG TPA: YciI family protein [Alphaproteobacteria bacterium]|nr:YciI family protein [Alphaproteobacteria bacterium]HNS43607.1 YciI family protein [Alphaproteobacteria bacterium]